MVTRLKIILITLPVQYQFVHCSSREITMLISLIQRKRIENKWKFFEGSVTEANIKFQFKTRNHSALLFSPWQANLFISSKEHWHLNVKPMDFFFFFFFFFLIWNRAFPSLVKYGETFFQKSLLWERKLYWSNLWACCSTYSDQIMPR